MCVCEWAPVRTRNRTRTRPSSKSWVPTPYTYLYIIYVNTGSLRNGIFGKRKKHDFDIIEVTSLLI